MQKPDGLFKFIFVMKDHFTRFLRIRPLEQKTGVAVAQLLFQIFTETGAPTILHTDNGREFRNKSVKSVVALFPPCKMVHGRPRNSRCQGSVELAILVAEAQKNILAQADEMLKRLSQLLPLATVGQSVFIKVPEFDRTNISPRNVIGVICEEKNGLFVIGTKFGVLDSMFGRADFELCTESFISLEIVPDGKISLRKAASMSSVVGGQGFTRCLCKSCDNNRCKCRKNNQACNSKCRSRHSCKNTCEK